MLCFDMPFCNSQLVAVVFLWEDSVCTLEEGGKS